MQHTSEIMHKALALLGGFASVVACICSCIFSMLSCIVPAAFYRLAGSSSRSQQINWFGNPKTQGLGGSHGDVRKKRLDFLYAAEQRVDSCKRRPELGSAPHLAHIRAACGSIKPVVIRLPVLPRFADCREQRFEPRIIDMSEDLGIQGRGTFLPRGRHDPRAASGCRRSRLACDCGGTPCVATPHCSRAMTPLRHRRRSLSRSSSIRREPGDPLQRSISSAEIAGGVTPRRRNPRHVEILGIRIWLCFRHLILAASHHKTGFRRCFQSDVDLQ